MTLLSVISSSRALGARPLMRSTCPIPLARSGSRNWRGERLTLIDEVLVRPARAPQLCLPARLLEDDPADRDDQLRFLGEGDEVDREHEAARRVLPAREGLEADDASRSAGRGSAGSGRSARHARARSTAPPRRRGARGRAGCSAGRSGRCAGSGRRLAPISAISASWSTSPPPDAARRADRDAHARADEPRPAVEVERRLELELDTFGDRHGCVRVGVREQHGERVPTESRHGVAGPERAQDPLADLAEDAVACRVPEALVDDLEAVEVEEDHRDGRPLRADGRQRRARRPPAGSASRASAGS